MKHTVCSLNKKVEGKALKWNILACSRRSDSRGREKNSRRKRNSPLVSPPTPPPPFPQPRFPHHLIAALYNLNARNKLDICFLSLFEVEIRSLQKSKLSEQERSKVKLADDDFEKALSLTLHIKLSCIHSRRGRYYVPLLYNVCIPLYTASWGPASRCNIHSIKISRQAARTPVCKCSRNCLHFLS